MKKDNKFYLNTKTRHGLSSHKLYNIWEAIVQRCSNENNIVFAHYGARGIGICKDWRVNFISFYNWSIDNGYKEGLTIDRIDNNGNYEPDNCRWVEQNIQIRNTRKIRTTNTSGYRGVSFYKKTNKFRARICVDYKDIYLGYFSTAESAAKAYDKYVIDNNLEHTRNFG